MSNKNGKSKFYPSYCAAIRIADAQRESIHRFSFSFYTVKSCSPISTAALLRQYSLDRQSLLIKMERRARIREKRRFGQITQTGHQFDRQRVGANAAQKRELSINVIG
jgi:hypothetical protein